MLCLIRIHARPVPAIKIGKFYLVGGDGLRSRAIYLYRQGIDYAGMPALGQQVFRAILSHDYGRVTLHLHASPMNYRGLTILLPGVTWNFAYRFRRIGGLWLYRQYQRFVVNPLSPSRQEHSICPHWNLDNAERTA